jgi:4-hydroxybenzoate polyprenyltransferase
MLQERSTQAAAALFSARELLRCDAVTEAFLAGLKRAPSEAFFALAAMLRGTSPAEAIAAHLPFDPSAMLYDAALLQRIETLKANGTEVALVPDLPAPWSRAIAAYLGIKTDATGTSLPEVAPAAATPNTFAANHSNGLKLVFKALRIHQWPKNALVFLPLFLSHRFLELGPAFASLIAFFAIGFAASTIYVVNDLMDAGADRRHPSKRNRPFASGALPARYGFLLLAFSLASAIGLCMLLPPMFAVVLLTYVGVNLVYTTYLKRKLLVDVLALAGSYTLRILAGNAATGIELSFWLLAFSIFMFFSLALVKRYVEMDTIGAAQPNEKRVMGRGYRYVDLEMLSQMGVASAFAAVLVLALYVERSGTTGLYTRPELIWLICPIVLYVVSRIWFLAKRGEMKDDPVAFILNDWRSHLMGAIVAVIMIAASW